MKIGLIVTRNEFLDEKQRLGWDDLWEFQARKRLWSTPNLSLLTVAGMIPPDFSIDYTDLNYQDEIYGQYDWVFFSPSTSEVRQAYLLADKLRKNGVKIAMGGPHVTVLPEEALQHADTVFIGEAEETFPAFLKDMKTRQCHPIYRAEKPPNLELCPTPRYDLIQSLPYQSIPIQTSRGCPHQCSFCISSKIYGLKCRRKTIAQIEKELDAILEIKKRPFIFFTDDNLFYNAGFTQRLIALMKTKNLNWYAFSDARIAYQPEVLDDMVKSGCTQVLIGFESINSGNLAAINHSLWKMNHLKDYPEIIHRIQSRGIGVVGSFVVGLDNDRPEVFDELYQFVDQNCLYATNITILTPFPGTEIHRQFLEEERITEKDWAKYNGFELVYKPKSMSVGEFNAGYERLNQQLNAPDRMKKVIGYFKNFLNRKYENAK